MPHPLRRQSLQLILAALFMAALLIGFGCASSRRPALPPAATAPAPKAPEIVFPVMPGIDVLAGRGFDILAGRRVGLLTHPAGVNRRGESTIDILRHAPNVNLVALFGPEHGIYGDEQANQPVADRTDPRTGLPVHSLYGATRKPTPEMLEGLDVLVIDLQDIGVRSYTYVSCMRLAIEACFEKGIEVVVLDRPNPLGGLKVDGPPLDREWRSYVGAFCVPYVHGLTIGELANMCARAPGVLNIDDSVRLRGRLTVIPMKGWRRDMRWPETGLKFVPTSPYIQDFASVVGYAMTGLGCQIGGFVSGIGPSHPFRSLSFKGQPLRVLEPELQALKIPGVGFQRIQAAEPDGRVLTGIYIAVNDWDAWHPTELSFNLMRLACKLNPSNPFAAASASQRDLFNKHTGSQAWWDALVRDGAKVDVEAFIADWQQRARIYQEQSRRYWLY